jgi:hypothetical protein
MHLNFLPIRKRNSNALDGVLNLRSFSLPMSIMDPLQISLILDLCRLPCYYYYTYNISSIFLLVSLLILVLCLFLAVTLAFGCCLCFHPDRQGKRRRIYEYIKYFEWLFLIVFYHYVSAATILDYLSEGTYLLLSCRWFNFIGLGKCSSHPQKVPSKWGLKYILMKVSSSSGCIIQYSDRRDDRNHWNLWDDSCLERKEMLEHHLRDIPDMSLLLDVI